MEQYVAAVDIGTTKLAIAVARVTPGTKKIEVTALYQTDSRGVNGGVVLNLDDASRSINAIKSQLEEKIGHKIDNVYVGLTGQHISCTSKVRDISIGNGCGMTEITEDDMDRLTRDTLNLSNSRNRHVITILPQSYKIDDEEDILSPIGMEGGRLEGTFNVVEGEISAIDRVERCIKRSNLSISQILLNPLASAEAVLSDDEKELGVAVVDIGGGTTDLCIYYDKIIKNVSVLAVGGTNVNKDIKGCGVLERLVEKLKTMYGEAIASETNDDIIELSSVHQQPAREIEKRELARIIEKRMLEIVNWVKEQISNTMQDKTLSAGIVITGGGANLKNIELLFKRELNCNVRVARPTPYLTEQSAELYDDPCYSTLIGMLYMALKPQIMAVKTKTKSRSDVNDKRYRNPNNDKYRRSVEQEEPDDYDDSAEDDYYDEEEDEEVGRIKKPNIFSRFFHKFMQDEY